MIIELEKKGETVVLISVNDVVEGLISISDEIRNNSQKTINDLKIMGFKIVLLSGDSYSTTKNIATKLGINEFFAEVLPNKKASIISKLQNKGNIVAMVGDGINDAPALFQSDVGITIGKTADITLETGNIIIMNNDIYNVVYSIKLGQKTLQKIKQNLFWAFLYNICLIPIAASGLLNPGLAAIAMVLSSLSVLINSLRIKYSKLS